MVSQQRASDARRVSGGGGCRAVASAFAPSCRASAFAASAFAASAFVLPGSAWSVSGVATMLMPVSLWAQRCWCVIVACVCVCLREEED